MSQLPKRMGPAIKAWNEAIQKRVSITSSILGSLRETKILGFVPIWLEYIQSLRVSELQASKKFRMFVVYMNVLGTASKASLIPIKTNCYNRQSFPITGSYFDIWYYTRCDTQ